MSQFRGRYAFTQLYTTHHEKKLCYGESTTSIWIQILKHHSWNLASLTCRPCIFPCQLTSPLIFWTSSLIDLKAMIWKLMISNNILKLWAKWITGGIRLQQWRRTIPLYKWISGQSFFWMSFIRFLPVIFWKKQSNSMYFHWAHISNRGTTK